MPPYRPPSPLAGVAFSVHTQSVATATPTSPRVIEVADQMYYEQDFVNSAQWTVHHNLGQYPNVSILDTGGEEVFADVQHVDINTVVVTWPAPFTGKVVCS